MRLQVADRDGALSAAISSSDGGCTVSNTSAPQRATRVASDFGVLVGRVRKTRRLPAPARSASSHPWRWFLRHIGRQRKRSPDGFAHHADRNRHETLPLMRRLERRAVLSLVAASAMLQSERTPHRTDYLDFLEGRRSQPSRQLGEPGPTPEQLERLLPRRSVPDHGKLTPWRLLLIRGEDGQGSARHWRNPPASIRPYRRQSCRDRDTSNLRRRRRRDRARRPDHPRCDRNRCCPPAMSPATRSAPGARLRRADLAGWAAYDRRGATARARRERTSRCICTHWNRAERAGTPPPALSDVVSEWTGLNAGG
jgi:hypothetical protein